MSGVNWQELYTAALAEPDPNKLRWKIEAARRAINDRLDQIGEVDSSTREREQLDRALHALFTLPARRRSA